MGRKSNASAKRAEIVQALYECLSQKGHEKVTTKEIAAQAGVGPGVIHYYFKSKDEIVACLMEELALKYESVFSEIMSKLEGEQDFVDLFCQFLCDEFIFNRPLNRVFYNLVQMGFESTVVQAPLQTMMGRYRQKGQEYFSIKGEALDEEGYLMVALVEGLALQWMIEPDHSKETSIRNLVITMMRQMIG